MNNNQESLLKVKRILSFITSIGLLGISIWFSKMGFGTESDGKYEWIGWFLGFVVMVGELVFNTSIQKLNPTLIASGILFYSYGMYTNVIGLQDVLGVSFWFAVVLGLFLEVLPEPLFAWAIGVSDGGDVVGNIGELFGRTSYQNHPNYRNMNQPVMGFHKPEDMMFRTPSVKNKDKSWMNQKSRGSKANKVVNRIFHDPYVDKFKPKDK